jgi:16S rRNA (cytosine967-C5)-methyltransferase
MRQSNHHPPMTLRVNLRRTSCDDFLLRLDAAGIGGKAVSASAVILDKPVAVSQIPGFALGAASVQDAGAQFAATLLDVSPGMRVLDACAAPGGKTGHILEHVDCELVAVENDAVRAIRISENLTRLGLRANIQTADCLVPQMWWDGRPFDRILLDAPCSASGVVRRHPDIKWLRRPRDIKGFAATQARMLDVMWPLLSPGGKLLYVTCSVFPEENEKQIEVFFGKHPDAKQELFAKHQEVPADGRLLPNAWHDGFYYALLRKVD